MKRLISITRVAVALMLFVAVVEVCARLDDRLSYQAPMWGPYSHETLYETDGLGKRGKPGARYKKWQLNSLGYRGPELRDGTVRIVCFGASETFGLYESDGKEYPRQLESELNARAGEERFQVVNVAYAGQTLATATVRVPEILSKIRPQVAVIYPSLAAYVWLPWVPRKNSGWPAAAPAQTATGFEWRIADRGRGLMKAVLPALIQTKMREYEVVRAASEYPVMDRVPEENVARFRSDLLDLIVELRSREVEPILVTHATAFGQHPAELDRDLIVAWRKFYPMLREQGFIDMERRMNDAIREVAAEQKVALVDAAREMPPGRAYFADFSHFTTVGAQLMASKLSDVVYPVLQAGATAQEQSTIVGRAGVAR
ncbi:MAG TPA: SGNH/GDSL hydrolase family protein [Terriglobales bacterium]|jgi:lysophospholipase L1-like esterase|nr:SGNH/GDSL hydrolase family protein [Terriglobales bacterium]